MDCSVRDYRRTSIERVTGKTNNAFVTLMLS
jgi:hypothetical protein